MSEVVEPEGSIRIITERDGIHAGVTLYFTFDGDWSNVYLDEPETEAEARKRFIEEVKWALGESNEASGDDQTERPSGLEDRAMGEGQ